LYFEFTSHYESLYQTLGKLRICNGGFFLNRVKKLMNVNYSFFISRLPLTKFGLKVLNYFQFYQFWQKYYDWIFKKKKKNILQDLFLNVFNCSSKIGYLFSISINKCKAYE